MHTGSGGRLCSPFIHSATELLGSTVRNCECGFPERRNNQFSQGEIPEPSWLFTGSLSLSATSGSPKENRPNTRGPSRKVRPEDNTHALDMCFDVRF